MAAFSAVTRAPLRFLFPIQFAELATIEAQHIAEFERHAGLELATERCRCALTHGVAPGHGQTTTLLGLKILCARFRGSGSGLRSGGPASCKFQRGAVRGYVGLVAHSHDRERDGFSAFREIEHDHVGVVDDR